MAEQSKSGIVTGLIYGAGALIVLTMVVLVIVSTLDDANLLRETATATTASENNAWINSTTYTLTGFSSANRNYAITNIVNATDGVTITSGNYTFVSSTGILSNTTATTWDNVNITYTYIAPTTYESTTDGMAGNFTSGIDNVSSKIPTILLIGAVILLFGVIVSLVKQSQAMGIGTNNSGSL